MSLSCRKYSFIYQSLSITAAVDPLLVDLITMLCLLSDLRHVVRVRSSCHVQVQVLCYVRHVPLRLKKCLVRFLVRFLGEEEESECF